MTRSSAAVSLVLVGSALAYGVYRCAQQPDDADPDKAKHQSHSTGGGHSSGFYHSSGSGSGSRPGAASSPRGGFGSTGHGASTGS